MADIINNDLVRLLPVVNGHNYTEQPLITFLECGRFQHVHIEHFSARVTIYMYIYMT